MTDRPAPDAAFERLAKLQLDSMAAARDALGALARRVSPSGSEGVTLSTTMDDASETNLLDTFDLYFDLAKYAIRAAASAMSKTETTDSTPNQVAAIFVPTAPGSATGTEPLWIHNRTDDAFRDLDLRCGQLESASGAHLDGRVIQFEPSRVDDLGPHSSARITLTANLDQASPAGLYRGVIHVDGVDELWAPLEVTVGGASST